MKIKFYLKRPNAKTETTLIALVNYNGETLKVYPGESINPKYWNRTTQTARNTPKFPEHPEFNERLNQIRGTIGRVFMDYRNRNSHAIPSPAVLKPLIESALGGGPQKVTFLDYFKAFADRSAAGDRINPKTGQPVKKTGAKGYTTTLNHLQEFNSVWNRKLDFDTVDVKFHQEFTAYLQGAPLLLSANTTGSHIKRIKAVMAEATEGGVNSNMGFKSKYFIKQSEEADTIYLSAAELKDMQALNLSDSPKLDNVRDLFLIGCYTGLRFSDFSIFNPKTIVDGFIKITQSKTSDPVVIPIHTVVKGIIAKNGGEAPRHVSNQKLNEYLKDIGKLMACLDVLQSKSITKGGKRITTMVKKWELLSSHAARRSFATNEYLAGTPTITIMAITGHKTEKAFLKYIRVTPDEHAKKIKELWRDRERTLKAV
jgi:integrase